MIFVFLGSSNGGLETLTGKGRIGLTGRLEVDANGVHSAAIHIIECCVRRFFVDP